MSLLGGNMKKIGTVSTAGSQARHGPNRRYRRMRLRRLPVVTPEGTIFTSANFPIQRVTDAHLRRYLLCWVSSTSGKPYPMRTYIAGGFDSPASTKFVRGDIVFLKGSRLHSWCGIRDYSRFADINKCEMFPGQMKLLRPPQGSSYEEVGRVRILDTRSKTAVAQIEYSCDPLNLGDTAIPFAEKQMVQFHPPLRFDRFLPAGSKVSGRIVMAKDFDSAAGNGSERFISTWGEPRREGGGIISALCGTYEATLDDPVDSLSFRASVE